MSAWASRTGGGRPSGPGGSLRAQQDPAGVEAARRRIKHVVVLMLENRSFDHVFGYVPGLGLEPLDDRWANPLDPADPDAAPKEPPSPTARHILAVDPPHSHAGAKQQMGTPRLGPGGQEGDCPMDGFVSSYRLKLEGKEHLPVFHWRRIRAAALLASPLGAMAVRNALFLLSGRGWARFLRLAGPGTGVLAGIVLPKRTVRRLAGISQGKSILGAVAGGAAAGLTVQGVWQAVTAPTRRLVPWMACGATAAFAATALAERSAARKRQPVGGAGEAERAALSRRIMHCQPPEHVKVLSELARSYALCTRWHASVPGATWPNRNFLHTGSSQQSVDIEVGLYGDETLFNALDDAARQPGAGAPLTDPPWRIYYDDLPQVIVFERLLEPRLSDRWRPMDRFFDDVAGGNLASYTFIEPRHRGRGRNSFHPGNNQAPTDGSSDFARGEELVRRIYEALRRSEHFDDTVLVVTFDEHGGLFDGASPPKTVPPEWGHALRHPASTTRRAVAWFVEMRNAPFDFRRLGMRVPTVVVSPRARPQVTSTLYDHTSVIATVCDLFAPDALRRFGQRAAQAEPFWPLVDLDDGRTDPVVIPPPGYPREPWPEPGAPAPAAAGVPDGDTPASSAGYPAPARQASGPSKAGLDEPSPTPVDGVTAPGVTAARPDLTGGDLPDQLAAVVPKVHRFLDEQNAPPAPPPAEGPARMKAGSPDGRPIEAAPAGSPSGEAVAPSEEGPSPGEDVMLRLQAWSGTTRD